MKTEIMHVLRKRRCDILNSLDLIESFACFIAYGV